HNPLAFHDDLLFAGYLKSEPDAYRGEEQCNQAAVDFDGVFQDDEAIFNEFERRNQKPATEAVDQAVDERLFLHAVWSDGPMKFGRRLIVRQRRLNIPLRDDAPGSVQVFLQPGVQLLIPEAAVLAF